MKQEKFHKSHSTSNRHHVTVTKDINDGSVLDSFSHTVDQFCFGIFYKFLFNRQMTIIMMEIMTISESNVKTLDLKLLPLKICLLIYSIYVLYDTIHHLQNSRMFSAIVSFLLLHDLLRMAFNCSMRGYFLNCWRKLDIDIDSAMEMLDEHMLDQCENWMIFEHMVQWDTIIEGTFWKFVIAPFVFSIFSLYDNLPNAAKEMI
jgi:hypothetical protein